MRWTVLLPTHAAPATLALAIDSVFSQRDREFELIVVGDGCGDETRAIIARYADPRLRFIDNPKGAGYGYEHRKAALASARGDFVAFMSDDDLWGPSHLLRLGRLLDAGSALAYSRSLWCVPTGQLVPLHFDLTDPVAARYFAERNYLPAPCVTIARSALEAAGGWPADVASAADWLLWRRVLALPGSTVAYDHEVSSIHFRSTRRSTEPLPVEAILAMPDFERSWPAGARIIQGEYPTLQAATAARFEDPAFWSELSAALGLVDSRLVLAATTLGSELLRVISRQNSASAELDRVYSSLSWRVTAPLRRVRAARRPPE
jgi:hypothetical protein